MTKDDRSRKAVEHWLSRARESLAAAKDEAAAGRLSFAVSRCYFAVFYAASAVLLERGRRFAKHSGVRAAVHRDLVKTGLLSAEWGKVYDRLFQERQQGDYVELVKFEREEVDSMIEQSTRCWNTWSASSATPTELKRQTTARAGAMQDAASRKTDLVKLWLDDFNGSLPVKMKPRSCATRRDGPYPQHRFRHAE